MITYKDKYIQIDPVAPFADYSTLPKADIILITHEHRDYLDNGAIEALTKENILLVTNKSSIDIIGKGEAIPAYNTAPGREKFHPKHRDSGYILIIENLRKYIADDTKDGISSAIVIFGNYYETT